jgi:hypothetical protein
LVFPKEFFDLQFSFAERVQASSGMSLERALFEYTNFYVRFGCGRRFDDEHESWRAYVAGVRNASDGRDWTYRFYLRDPEATTAPPVVATFGCFSYAFQAPDVVRLHFVSTDRQGNSPLGAPRLEHRRAELTALFGHLKRTAGEGVTVVGTSWLYNLEAYRRLFPPAYVSSARAVRGRFRSMPLWGQFLDYRGRVKEALNGAFLETLSKQTTITNLDECFPFSVLAVEASAHQFYDHYDVA